MLTKTGDDCLIMAQAHVAHDCLIGDGVIMANAATLAGHVVIEDRANIGAYSGVHQFCRVGKEGLHRRLLGGRQGCAAVCADSRQSCEVLRSEHHRHETSRLSARAVIDAFTTPFTSCSPQS